MSGKRLNIFFASCLAGLILLGNLNLKGQQVDPFYLNLLDKGEESFLAGNYKDAVKELEIAAFGLPGEEKLRAKAYVYLSLSYYYLKETDRSERYLKDAADLIDEQEFHRLEIAESVRAELENLLNYFRLRKAQKETPEISGERFEKAESEITKPGEKERAKKIENSLAIELEKNIKAQPRNIDLYYELYNIYSDNNNFGAAKKTLKNLVKNNPGEINGYYLLAKIEFRERNYKEAEKILEKILDLSKRVQIEERISTETRAYLILSSYLRGKRKKAQEMVSAWMDDFSTEKISSLSLDIKDQEKLQRIIKIYRSQAEAEREKVKIKKLEADIKKEPQDISLYYTLFGIHEKRKDPKRAKKVLQNLVKNNPYEMKGIFLLGKAEYFQKRYKEALRSFRRTLVISEESYADRELVMKSAVYTCLCLYHLKQNKSFERYLKDLYDSSSEAEIQQILREEGLEEEWENIRAQSSKRKGQS